MSGFEKQAPLKNFVKDLQTDTPTVHCLNDVIDVNQEFDFSENKSALPVALVLM